MTALRDASDGRAGPHEKPDNRLAGLIDDKAWQHLGLTGQEFRRLWYAGAYRDDPRPEIQALDQLMRGGQWDILDDTST